MAAHRNLLGVLVGRDARTHAEIVDDYNACARSLGEDGTVSVRTLRRWVGGDTVLPRSAQRRVAERFWGRSMEELLAPVGGEPGLEGIAGQVLTATRRASEFARMLKQGRVGEAALAGLKDEVVSIASAEQRLSARAVVGDLVQLQGAIFTVIERGGHRVRDARELFVGAAMTTAMLQSVPQDLGRPHQALSMCRTAYLCADAAEHLPLKVWARNEMSLISYRAGNPARALDFAESAIAISRDLRGSMRAWAWSLKARAAAQVHGEAEARAAIAQADRARAELVPDELDAIGGFFDFSAVRQRYYVAGALATLPDAGREAEAEATEAVRVLDESRGSYATEAGARSELALARAMSGEIDGANEALRPVLALPPERRIAGIVDSVGRVQRALGNPRLRGLRGSAGLRDEIEEYRQLTAATALGV